VIEPGWVDTELQGHNEHPLVVERMQKMIDKLDKVLEADDIARAVVYATSQPEHVNVNEIAIMPASQPT
jgi:NADP-dependent 3-hydroxy acid dehydrogenase YdfG